MIAKEKEALRKWMRAELGKLSSEQKQSASVEISTTIVNEINMMEAAPKRIASFHALSFEPDLASLHTLLPSAEIAYPLCREGGRLDFYLVNDPKRQLTKGCYGLLEPDPELCELVPLSGIDLFLVPAFAYTEDGQRLGKGGGYYDRALSGVGSKTIGVIFKCQLLESIPTDSHDVKIGHLIAL